MSEHLHDFQLWWDETASKPPYDGAHCECGVEFDSLNEFSSYVRDVEEKLAEYENDETARRRADAQQMWVLAAELVETTERVRWLLSKYVLDNGYGDFTFPDGDRWLIT